MTIADDVANLQSKYDDLVEAFERIAKIVGADSTVTVDGIIATVKTLAGEPADAVAAPSTARMTKSELLAAQKAGARVSFNDVPADASCTVDGVGVVLVADVKAVR